MKIIRWLSNWGPLYILAMMLIGALYWVQSLKLNTSADDILSIGFLVVFGFIANAWIDHHEANMIERDLKQYRVEQEKSDCLHTLHKDSQRLN